MKDLVSLDLGVVLKDEVPVVSSRSVAQVFEKEHKNVLTAIRNLDCSAEFNRLNFKPVKYRDEKGELRPEVLPWSGHRLARRSASAAVAGFHDFA